MGQTLWIKFTSKWWQMSNFISYQSSINTVHVSHHIGLFPFVPSPCFSLVSSILQWLTICVCVFLYFMLITQILADEIIESATMYCSSLLLFLSEADPDMVGAPTINLINFTHSTRQHTHIHTDLTHWAGNTKRRRVCVVACVGRSPNIYKLSR